MKVAMMIANKMFTSHVDEIKYLSKEALRNEIKLIIDREWTSLDPDKLIENVEQEIHKIALAKQEEKDKALGILEKAVEKQIDGGTYVTKSSWPTTKFDKKWLKDITDVAQRSKHLYGEWITPQVLDQIEKDKNEFMKYEYKIAKPRFKPTIGYTYRFVVDDKFGSKT